MHGICHDTIEFVHRIITTEMNSVTDNPIVLPERGEVLGVMFIYHICVTYFFISRLFRLVTFMANIQPKLSTIWPSVGHDFIFIFCIFDIYTIPPI